MARTKTDDLYGALGVDRNADPDAIKRAYRRKAKNVHPDAGGSADEFSAIARAYETLISPAKRLQYDRTGTIDDAADNADAAAMAIIGEMMNQVMGQAGEIVTTDVVASIRGALDERANAVAGEIARARRSVARLGKLAARFQSKGPNNILRAMVEANIRGLEGGIAAAETALAAVRRAKDIMKDYSFVADTVEQHVMVFRADARTAGSCTFG